MGLAPPLVGVAVKVTEVPAQMVLPELLVILTNGLTGLLTVMEMALLEAVVGLAQLALLVSTQVTTSPLIKVPELKLGLLLPTLLPFTCHWYKGLAPPFVGVAVKITEVPEQTVFPGLAEMPTEGVTLAFTVMTIELLVAVAGLAQE